MKAPFPWFGGKSAIAGKVWRRIGWDVPQYIEPFFGSGAMLLGRPGWRSDLSITETVNDKDGMISNFWRATQHDPQAVAHFADNPVNENDLTARHIWLVNQKFSTDFIARLEGDPDYYDAKIAGWWVWGCCCWIGSGWCSGRGPWSLVDGKLVHLGDPVLPGQAAGRGVNRQRVHLSDAGMGVNRQLVHLSSKGGVKSGAGEAGLYEWFDALAARLARVRVCSGDWARVVTNGAMMNTSRLTAVFLDPPYSAEADRHNTIYAEESLSIAHEVRRWALENGDNPMLRIALCGYEGEHAMPDGWRKLAWKAHGGMGNIGNPDGSGRGARNSHREVVWFSPHCLNIADERQMALFESEAPA